MTPPEPATASPPAVIHRHLPASQTNLLTPGLNPPTAEGHLTGRAATLSNCSSERSWNDSWNGPLAGRGVMGALRAIHWAICAGRARGAAERASFNPWVQGSIPWRPTSGYIAFGPASRGRVSWKGWLVRAFPALYDGRSERSRRATTERLLARRRVRRGRSADRQGDLPQDDREDRAGGAGQARAAVRGHLIYVTDGSPVSAGLSRQLCVDSPVSRRLMLSIMAQKIMVRERSGSVS